MNSLHRVDLRGPTLLGNGPNLPLSCEFLGQETTFCKTQVLVFNIINMRIAWSALCKETLHLSSSMTGSSQV